MLYSHSTVGHPERKLQSLFFLRQKELRRIRWKNIEEAAFSVGPIPIYSEVKDREISLKKAMEELAVAKENRGAAIGILVWAKGCEPVEVGDFCMIDEDFFCAVDKDDLGAGRPLLFLEAAYKVARMVAVLRARKETSGAFDIAQLHAHVGAVIKDVAGLATLAKKAGCMKSAPKTWRKRYCGCTSSSAIG